MPFSKCTDCQRPPPESVRSHLGIIAAGGQAWAVGPVCYASSPLGSWVVLATEDIVGIRIISVRA